jgi:CRISPR-associated protein Csm1
MRCWSPARYEVHFNENDPSEDAQRWPILRHRPQENGDTLDLDQIAKKSHGARNWLAYLRMDGDGIGKLFKDVEGNPLPYWGLSRLLTCCFVDAPNRLLDREEFRNIYPVYGGGDDLFLIGAWNEVLDFALELHKEITLLVENDLTFSAGLSLAKPKEHILTQANLAFNELERAKKEPSHGRRAGKDQIRALGVTMGWETFPRLLKQAKEVTQWVEQKKVPRSFLYQLLQLHRNWRECMEKAKGRETAKAVRYKPLLYYQIQRNLGPGPARDWAEKLLKSQSLWPWADFIAGYALLATGQK